MEGLYLKRNRCIRRETWGHIAPSIFKQKSVLIPVGSNSGKILMKLCDMTHGQKIRKCTKYSKPVDEGKII